MERSSFNDNQCGSLTNLIGNREIMAPGNAGLASAMAENVPSSSPSTSRPATTSSGKMNTDDAPEQESEAEQDTTEILPKEPQKPSRPLTAYNIFFKHTRKAMLDAIPDVELPKSSTAKKRPAAPGSKVPHGKIGFADLARQIAAKWKVATKEEQAYFLGLAKEDKERYLREMDVWKRLKRERAIAERRLKANSKKSKTGKRKSMARSSSVSSCPSKATPTATVAPATLTANHQIPPRAVSTPAMTPTSSAAVAQPPMTAGGLYQTSANALVPQVPIAPASSLTGMGLDKAAPFPQPGGANGDRFVSLLSMLKSTREAAAAAPAPTSPLALKTSMTDSADPTQWWKVMNAQLVASPPASLAPARSSLAISENKDIPMLPAIEQDGSLTASVAPSLANNMPMPSQETSATLATLFAPTPLQGSSSSSSTGTNGQATAIGDLADTMGDECTDLFLNLFQ